ncbi:MAG TPA: hypothetical protein VF648_13750 [Pyrinomonadaceae bacterium]
MAQKRLFLSLFFQRMRRPVGRGLVIEGTGEKIMVDIFTLLLAIVSICALAGVTAKIMLTPPKVWDEEDWIPFEIEDVGDYEETGENKPHIWMD